MEYILGGLLGVHLSNRPIAEISHLQGHCNRVRTDKPRMHRHRRTHKRKVKEVQ